MIVVENAEKLSMNREKWRDVIVAAMNLNININIVIIYGRCIV